MIHSKANQAQSLIFVARLDSQKVFAIAMLLGLLHLNAINSWAQVYSIPSIPTPEKLPNLSALSDQWAEEYGKRIKKMPKRKFIIVFKNDSTIIAQTNVEKILDSYIMIVGKKDDMVAIKPAQTKNVYRKLNNGTNIPGIPFDRGWIFKINEGPIYTYSYFPEATSKYENIVAIQKGDGPIVLLTRGNLMEMLERDSKAMSLAEEGDLEESIRTYNHENRR
jgi:hypothetical protein